MHFELYLINLCPSPLEKMPQKHDNQGCPARQMASSGPVMKRKKY